MAIHSRLVIIGIITACVCIPGFARSARSQAVRDSAGIRIIENQVPARSATQMIRLSARPILVIGNRAGSEYEFSRIEGVARLADGRIVVADGASLQLRVFDSLGNFIRNYASAGDGPGELRNVSALHHLRGDTLALTFGTRGGASFFSAEGKHLFRINSSNGAVPGAPRAILNMTMAVFGNGTSVVAPISMQPAPRAAGARWVESVAVSILGRDTQILHLLDTLPMWEVAMDDIGPRPPWFAADPSFAANDSYFFYGFGSEYRIRVYTRDGRLERIISRRWTLARVTQADIDTYVVEWGKRWIKSTGTEAEKARADLRNDPYATRVPAFSQLIADRAGGLWAREPHLADAPGNGQLNTVALVPTVWSVFNAAGRWQGDVTMPAHFVPMEIGPGYVLGVTRDGDGVETVVQYALGVR